MARTPAFVKSKAKKVTKKSAAAKLSSGKAGKGFFKPKRKSTKKKK